MRDTGRPNEKSEDVVSSRMEKTVEYCIRWEPRGRRDATRVVGRKERSVARCSYGCRGGERRGLAVGENECCCGQVWWWTDEGKERVVGIREGGRKRAVSRALSSLSSFPLLPLSYRRSWWAFTALVPTFRGAHLSRPYAPARRCLLGCPLVAVHGERRKRGIR